MCRDKYLAAMG